MAQLLKGKTLLKKHGQDFKEVDAENELKNKVVALYFSAHWCPPCKMFTPVLKDFYEELENEPFEVVFVSYDRAEPDLKSYMKEMHGDWCAIPFGDENIQEFGNRYGVQGIPMLVIIKPDGTAIGGNARGDVQGKSKAPKALFNEWKTQCGI